MTLEKPSNEATDEELNSIYENAWDEHANGKAARRALYNAGNAQAEARVRELSEASTELGAVIEAFQQAGYTEMKLPPSAAVRDVLAKVRELEAELAKERRLLAGSDAALNMATALAADGGRVAVQLEAALAAFPGCCFGDCKKPAIWMAGNNWVCEDHEDRLQGEDETQEVPWLLALELTEGLRAALASAQPAAPVDVACYCSDRMSGGVPCPPGRCPNVPKPPAGQSSGIDPRPRCIRCGKPWLPDEGLDATVWPCTECYGEAAKEASEP